MVKCKDGRKHVIVKEYHRKDGGRVARYERSCPSAKSSDNLYYCCVCGDECDDDSLHEIDIRGEAKKICNECVDTIHGLM
ncbi:MAG: hypothetical protein IMZ43_05955 [Thermoplasmata archaeon]|nr:hypothetical protein [Thermoplasmata archaeon]